MADIILNLSGRAGLADNFSGDTDVITPQPNLVLEAGEGQMASGSFNPYLRKNYLAPITTTSVSLTTDVAPTYELSSVVYDNVNNDLFFAEHGRYVYKADGLTDTSLAQIIDVGAGNTIQDLEIYEIQSKRNLFYVYTTPSIIDTLGLSRRGYWETLSIEANPAASTKPTVIASFSETYGSNVSTFTVDVPAGSNIACAVMISTYAALTHVKLDTVAMTQTYSTTKSYGNYTKYTYVYTEDSVTAGTKTIEISASETTSVNVVFTDNTNTTTPFTVVDILTGMSSTAVGTGTHSDTKLLLSNLVVENAVMELTSSPVVTSYNPAAQTTTGQCVYVSPDGTKMYVGGSGSGGGTPSVFQYTLSTPYLLSSATYATKALNYSAVFGTGSPASMQFNSTGTVMLLMGGSYATTEKVEAWDLGTAWDVSTATYNAAKQSPSLANGNASVVSSFNISSDGLTMYISGTESGIYPTVYQYELSTAWDPSTATYADKKLRMSTLVSGLSSFAGALILLNNDEHAIIQKESTGDTFYGINFNPLFPKDISKCTLATSSTGEDEILVDATNPPIGTMSYAGGYLYYRKNGNEYVIRYAPQQRTLPNISTDSRTISYSGSASLWSSISYLSTGVGLECGILKLPASSVKDDTWLSGTSNVYLSSASNYNFIRKADNGFAYLFTNNGIHKIDGGVTGGAAGTVTKNIVIFPNYFTITDAVDYRSKFYIAVHQYPFDTTESTTGMYSGNVGIIVWNRISTQLGATEFISIPGVREIKKIYASPDGLLKLICISEDGTTELRQFGYNDSGGVVFPVQKRLGIGAFPLLPDGVTTAGDKVTWLANDGIIYCEKENSVTKLFQVKTPGTTTATTLNNITSGVLFYGNGDETGSTGFRSNKQALTFSYLDGSTPYTKKIYPFDLNIGANTAQTPSQGDVYTCVKLIPIGSNVKGLRIYNAPITGTGTTVIATVKLYFNQSTTASTPSGMTKSITKDEAKRGYVDFKINSHNIHAVQVEVEWSTAITLGEDMYLPSMAIVDYEETTSRSPDGE